MFDTSQSRRSRVQSVVGGVEIVMPRQAGFTTAFLGLWLCGWAFGEVAVIRQLLAGGSAVGLFLVVWLLGWTLGGGWAILTFLWSLAGEERVAATREQLVVTHALGPWHRVQRFDPRTVEALRVIDAPSGLEARGRGPSMPFWGGGTGPLAFDSGFRTVRLGAGLSEAEARVIAREIAEHARISVAASGGPSMGVSKRDDG